MTYELLVLSRMLFFFCFRLAGWQAHEIIAGGLYSGPLPEIIGNNQVFNIYTLFGIPISLLHKWGMWFE